MSPSGSLRVNSSMSVGLWKSQPISESHGSYDSHEIIQEINLIDSEIHFTIRLATEAVRGEKKKCE